MRLAEATSWLAVDGLIDLKKVKTSTSKTKTFSTKHVAWTWLAESSDCAAATVRERTLSGPTPVTL